MGANGTGRALNQRGGQQQHGDARPLQNGVGVAAVVVVADARLPRVRDQHRIGAAPAPPVRPPTRHAPTVLPAETTAFRGRAPADPADGAQSGTVSTPLKTTKTIERTDTRVDETTRDDTPKFFHYVK